MSCSQWEQGTITLPTSAVAPLKQALRRAHNEMFDAILAIAKQWEPRYVDQKPRRGHVPVGLPEPRTEVERHAHQAIFVRFHSRVGKDRLGRLVAADLVGYFGPRATNRTTEFRCYPGTASFNGRELTWTVDEGNRNRDDAHSEFLHRTLERFLARVEWSRGSGGILFGNDEYHEESLGASGDYITAKYGPLGAKASSEWMGYGRSR